MQIILLQDAGKCTKLLALLEAFTKNKLWCECTEECAILLRVLTGETGSGGSLL